jgi:hypothetical protein
MRYQTFTKKEKIELTEFQNQFKKQYWPILEKHYSNSRHTVKNKGNGAATAEIQNIGGLYATFTNKPYDGILCNTYIEYLGFRDTKKFNNMLNDIEKSLEDICYIHTGERK